MRQAIPISILRLPSLSLAVGILRSVTRNSRDSVTACTWEQPRPGARTTRHKAITFITLHCKLVRGVAAWTVPETLETMKQWTHVRIVLARSGSFVGKITMAVTIRNT